MSDGAGFGNLVVRPEYKVGRRFTWPWGSCISCWSPNVDAAIEAQRPASLKSVGLATAKSKDYWLEPSCEAAALLATGVIFGVEFPIGFVSLPSRA